MQTCRNHCLFCFIDQMPKGVRSSLNVKDDDWRMSFIMGNYVTLTNVDDREFQRIIDRRVSPLYVSVHATDPEIRTKIMRNPTAGQIMDRLSALRDAGLRFHTQIVLCRGLNDGEILEKTLRDLVSLVPACASVAVVPVDDPVVNVPCTMFEAPPPVYVPVTDHILLCPLLIEIVVPDLMFPASKFVCETALMVCVPVRYWLALMVWSLVPG